MKNKKTILALLLASIPLSATAIVPFLIIAGAAAVGMLGYSIYTTFVPVDILGSAQFFSSCWSCNVFSEVLGKLSEYIPKIYSTMGMLIIPIATALLIVWFLWTIVSDYLKVKQTNDMWKVTGDFGTNIIKLVFISFLLAFPLPRFVMNTFIEPIMNIGLSYNNAVLRYFQPNDNSFDLCMVVTALKDKSDSETGAYAPKIRHNILCQIARFHHITGLGMGIGWTIANMSFSIEYGSIGPIPNVGLLAAGVFVLLGFLWALLPIPLYFLSVFLKLSIDLIMLPLALLNWMFKDWGIFPQNGAKNVGVIIDDIVKNTFGIALVGLFIGLSLMLLDSLIGDLEGIKVLTHALENNDSKFLMDALKLKNNSFFVLVMSGVFIGMIMNSIPTLINKLFEKANLVPDIEKMSQGIQKMAGNAGKTIKGWYNAITGKEPPTPSPEPRVG